MPLDLTQYKTPIFLNINDTPIAPIATKAGNGADLIDRVNGLVDELNSYLNLAVAPSSSSGLTANTTYYVSPTGSDTADGLTALTPFLTIQRAINVVSIINLNEFTVTIQLANGTYNTPVILKPFKSNGNNIIIQGNINNPANVIISPPGVCFLASGAGANYTLDGMKLSPNDIAIQADNYAALILKNLIYGPVNAHHLYANNGGIIKIENGYEIAGGAFSHACVSAYGQITSSEITVTLTNNPNFTGSFVYAERLGYVDFAYSYYNGSASGTRFTLTTGSLLYTNNDDLNFLPGSIDGTVASGGLYVMADNVTF